MQLSSLLSTPLACLALVGLRPGTLLHAGPHTGSDGPMQGPLEIGVQCSGSVSLSGFPAGDVDLFVTNHGATGTLAVTYEVHCTYANGFTQSILQVEREMLDPGTSTVQFVIFPISERAGLGTATVTGTARAKVVGTEGPFYSVDDSCTFSLVP
jgi:hypothetical protein